MFKTCLTRDQQGASVRTLRQWLAVALEAQASRYALDQPGDVLDSATEAAVRTWQAGVGLVGDGVVGPCTWARLERNARLLQAPASADTPASPADLRMSEGAVRTAFGATKPTNISRYLPYVKAALAACGLTDELMQAVALSCIRAEAEGFVPQVEVASSFNTLAGHGPFSAYAPSTEVGQRLGNQAPTDAALYRGRGFVPLTGRAAYAHLGTLLGLDLLAQPDLAASPEVAALALAHALTLAQPAVRKLVGRRRPARLEAEVLAAVHASVGVHLGCADPQQAGQRFAQAWQHIAPTWFQDAKMLAQAAAAAAEAESQPAADAAEPAPEAPAPATRSRRGRLDARKDPTDLRDRVYQPPPASLPPVYPSNAAMAGLLPGYVGAGLVLDQGQDGACTGFGLACVINYLRWRGHLATQAAPLAGAPSAAPAAPAAAASKRKTTRAASQSAAQAAGESVVSSSTQAPVFTPVSARMLYAFARRYDEYEGEDYEGSSCRGALKGWHHNGACLADRWGNGLEDAPLYGYPRQAEALTLGVYYRIDKALIADMQAAIHEVGAIYISTWVHAGWFNLPAATALGTTRLEVNGNPVFLPDEHADLPLIAFDGRHTEDSGGHAVALVGYNERGFVVQNSWGPTWGAGGFAVLSYADWLANGIDAWVAALGVPGVLGGRLAASGAGATATGAAQAAGPSARWWSERQAYDHSILLGNDGRVRRYLTEDETSRTLLHQVSGQADAWFRAQGGSGPRRVVLYAHGGLNNEATAIARAQVLGRTFMANGCFPLFWVWKTGLLETLGDLVADAVRGQAPASCSPGAARVARGGEELGDVSDRAVEATLGRGLARPVWSEIKQNARLAFEGGRGGELLARALAALHALWGDALEIHLIGHSAGALPLGHLADALAARRLPDGRSVLQAAVRSLHLYAPACTVAFANQHLAPHTELMRHTHIHLLSDEREREDNVAQLYRKSLLYLVSHALEADARTPLVGLARAWPEHTTGAGGWDGSSATTAQLRLWRDAVRSSGLADRLHVLSAPKVTICRNPPLSTASRHGTFDNDLATLTATLGTVLGHPPAVPVDDLRGH